MLVYSTWFGGLSEEGILAVKVDANGFIYVLGTSEDHAGFPVTPGAMQPQRAGTPAPGGLYPRDYFVSKFNPAGSALVYSTLFGGSQDEAHVGRRSTSPAGWPWTRRAACTSSATRCRPTSP